MEEVELQSDRRDDLCEWSHMYAKLCVYFYVKKAQRISLTVSINRVLNTTFEQSR